jgi:hypothetical protein
MAASFTLDTRSTGGNKFSGSEKVRRGTGNLGTSYATSGVAITPSMFQLRQIFDLIVTPTVATGDRLFTWDKTNSKILCFTALGTEAAGASDQSTKTFRVTVYGV